MMAAKRVWAWAVLLAGFAAVGCQHYCERHYPCPAPAAAAPNQPGAVGAPKTPGTTADPDSG